MRRRSQGNEIRRYDDIDSIDTSSIRAEEMKLRKKVFIAVLSLLMVLMFASCKARPDASLLPEPEVEFRAIKGIDSTEVKIQVLNVPKDYFGVYWGITADYAVKDASGNVLFEKSLSNELEIAAPIYEELDDVEAGDTLTCTVTFSYEGYTTSTTVTDVVE